MSALIRRADSLRLIALRLAVPPLEHIARAPGVGEACRITVQYHDGRLPDQIATLTISQAQAGRAELAIVYRRAAARPLPLDRPLTLTPAIPIARARAFAVGLRALGFDRLDDMPDLPWRGADLWLIERAAGTFIRDLVLAPESATGVYAALTVLVNNQLREAIRPYYG